MDFVAVSEQAAQALGRYANDVPASANPRADVQEYVRTRAFGLPVSTTHVLSSGVAGTMAANRSGLQISTVRNLLMAWVLTLPASILLAGSLFWLFSKIG